MKAQYIRAIILTLFVTFALTARAQAEEKKAADEPAVEKKSPTQSIPGDANVEIDISFVSFGLKEIEEMARKSASAAPTQEQILKAWAAGKGKLVATGKAVTIWGQQTKTEGILERIYPTEFEPPRVAADPPAKNEWSAHPTAGGFQTRNIGFTINLTPQLSTDGKCADLTLIPELSEFLGWDNIEASMTVEKKVSKVMLPQPDFYVRRVTTSVVVSFDQTMVTGGLPDSTGKNLTYVFITAHKLQTAR